MRTRSSRSLPLPISSTRGASLVEMMFVCAIGVLLIAIAVPPLRGALDAQRLQSTGDSLSTVLLEARRDAIRSNRPNTVDIDLNQRSVLTRGVTDAAGTLANRRLLVLPTGVAFDGTGNPSSITFDPLGRPAVLPATWRLVSTSSGQVRVVQVLATGRVQVN